jgi:hypothetical protein
MYGEYPVSHIVADIGHGGKSDIYAFGVQGRAVVLVSIMDVNADGKPDLVIHTDGTDTSAVLFNTGKSFQDRP